MTDNSGGQLLAVENGVVLHNSQFGNIICEAAVSRLPHRSPVYLKFCISTNFTQIRDGRKVRTRSECQSRCTMGAGRQPASQEIVIFQIPPPCKRGTHYRSSI